MDWGQSSRPPLGPTVNGGSDHGLHSILMALGEMRGGQAIILETVTRGFHEQARINREVAEDVATLKAHIEPEGSKPEPWWKGLPLKELALLAIIALSGALQVLQPGEVKSAARAVIMKLAGDVK